MKGIIFLIALTLQAGATATPPPGYRELKSKSLDLTLAGKDLEVVAMYEKFVAQYPNFAEGHMMLGGAHESVARGAMRSGAADPIALRTKHFEAAIVEMRRGLELAGPRPPFDWVRPLIDIHGIVGVNRPAEYEKLVRDAVTRYPAEPHAHSYLIALLASKGEPIDAAARAARAAIPKTADARVDLAGALTSDARDYRRLWPATGLNAVLAEASSLIDEALKMKPGDSSALRVRADIEQLRKQ